MDTAATTAAPLAPPDLPGLEALALPLLAIVALGAAALWLLRRRRSPARHVRVLETAPLGPRRSLVVCRLGDELLVLGSSEAGIHLLATRPAPPAPAPDPAQSQAGVLARMRLGRREDFGRVLDRSAAELDLRRKLASIRAGRAG